MRSYRANKLLAYPERHAGPRMGGVHTHPGFHTTGTEEVAACYAQAHAVTWLHYDPGDTLDDYPVIVVVDMSGFNPLADYDAEKQLWPSVLDLLHEFFRMNEGADESELATWLEIDPYDSKYEGLERGVATSDWLFKIASWRIDNPASALRDFVESYDGPDVMGLLARLASGEETPSQDMLCLLADQYRYTQDVDERRIVGVSYMRPFWPELLDYQGEESDEGLSERLEELGWSVMDVEDALNHQANVSTNEVYKKRPRSGERREYHGTTYRNLLSAAPRLARRWPVPPPPFLADDELLARRKESR